MKKKQILFFACCLALGSSTMDLCAQRTMDKLGRGLVATVTQSGSGNFVSWRVLGEEYYDVAYNLYANGELVAKGLSASNYVHTGGTAETRYTVAPVVKGKEGSVTPSNVSRNSVSIPLQDRIQASLECRARK